MKRFLLLLTITLLFSTFITQAQNPWVYEQSISFPDADSTVFPLLCEIDETNRLWVISSKALAPNAKNAIYYADPADTMFTLFIDFDRNGDSDTLTGNVGAARGIAALDGSVYLSFTIPYPKYAPFTISGMYRYDNADSNAAFRWIAEPGVTGGYGSYNHGIDITADSIIFAGITYNGPSFRLFNFSERADVGFYSSYSNWIPGNPADPAENNYGNLVEVGGGQTDGVDLIRDIAMVPGQNYNEVGSYFYTSRNAYAIDQLTGGIAVWQGGTILSALQYESARVEDFDGYLSLINSWPYGIDVDNNGTLWVAGIDSTRRWVKGFTVDGVNAIAEEELPSSTSMDFADPEGAPMAGPCDVSISKNGGLAFVIDAYAKKAYKFNNTLVGVEDDVNIAASFNLEQNFPNPFNPSTKISFTLAKASDVKLVVTDILGREVAALINGKLSAGNHSKIFDGKDFTSGIYIYSLTADGQKFSKKMMLVK